MTTPFFVECTEDAAAIPYWGVLYNRPVNLALCQSLRKASLTEAGRPAVPTLAFEGCATSWFFNAEKDRDAEMRRIITLSQTEGAARMSTPGHERFSDQFRRYTQAEEERASSGETAHAVLLANRVLDNPSLDPDGDLCVLARQFLRAHEARSKQLPSPAPCIVEPDQVEF